MYIILHMSQLSHMFSLKSKRFTWLCGAADRLLESAAVCLQYQGEMGEFDHMAVVSDPSHRAWPSVILIRSEQTERICPSLSAVGFRAMS